MQVYVNAIVWTVLSGLSIIYLYWFPKYNDLAESINSQLQNQQRIVISHDNDIVSAKKSKMFNLGWC